MTFLTEFAFSQLINEFVLKTIVQFHGNPGLIIDQHEPLEQQKKSNKVIHIIKELQGQDSLQEERSDSSL